LKSLQSLQAIASVCHNLQGLNLLGIDTWKVKDHITFREILSNMQLTHLVVSLTVFTSVESNKAMLISLYKKVFDYKRNTMCKYSFDENISNGVAFKLSYFPLLHYNYVSWYDGLLPTFVQNVINNCKELRCVSYFYYHLCSLSLNTTHNHNLQQLYINSMCMMFLMTLWPQFQPMVDWYMYIMIVQSLTMHKISYKELAWADYIIFVH